MNGISEIIGYPLGWIMWLLYKVFSNYGVSILIFTFLIRLILFPLSVKQQKSTAAMAAFNPKLEEIKKKYANNPQKQQEEQMKLYAEEDINPMASCLPMFFQLIFLYGVFDVVYRPISHIVRLGKQDLEALKTAAAPLFEGNNYFNSRPELYIVQAMNDQPQYFLDNGISQEIVDRVLAFNNRLFGIIDLGTIPKSVFDAGTDWHSAATIGLFLIPIISALIQLIMSFYSMAKQKKLNPGQADAMKSMNAVFLILPVWSAWLAFSFPAGIGYYWICSSLVGIIQTVVLHNIYTPEYVAKLVEKDRIKKKNSKRQGFMQKYQELMAEQMAAQNGSSKPVGTTERKIVSTGVVKDEETGEEVKLSKAKMKEYESRIIAEARKRQAEKYGDVYDENE